MGRLDAPGPTVSSTRAALLLLLGTLILPQAAHAHVGSPDVFHEGLAGPYRLFVTVRPPEVIPGIASVDVRLAGDAAAGVREVTVVPTPLTGEGADLAPRADRAERAGDNPALFVGRLWIMEKGAWRVRVHVDGGGGAGDMDVPVAAMPMLTRGMSAGLGIVLALLMVLLIATMAGIVRAAVGQALLEPGHGFLNAGTMRARTRRATMVAGAVAVTAVTLGLLWWRSEARMFGNLVFRPMNMTATVSGRQLTLDIAPPPQPVSPRRRFRKLLGPPLQGADDLLPDHGHLMHLFLVRRPNADAILHLHPERVKSGQFAQTLPAAPAGQYQVFADIVHASGLPETLTAVIAVPAGGEAPSGDDAVGAGPEKNSPTRTEGADGPTVVLADGTRVTWKRPKDDGDSPLPSARALWFRFQIAQADGQPATDVVPYMGMGGHAVFLARDFSVFAHIHPSGSVPMAALALASPSAMHTMHAGHHGMALPPEIAFPYGFPRPGAYRLFVQFKRGDTIETAIFDAVAR